MEGNIISARAGKALNALFPEPHRDKSIAKCLGITPRMAKYLRAGRFWTVERLALASEMLGQAFNEMLLPRDQPIVPGPADTVENRLDRIERQLEELIVESRRLTRGQENGSSQESAFNPIRVVR